MAFWSSPFFHILLLCGMIGNLVLPYSWGWVWRTYHPLKNDTILLSDPDSPVCWFQRVWRLILGVIFILCGIMLYHSVESGIHLDLFLLLSMIFYGSFGCIIPAFLSLTDIKYVESGPAKLHNLSYLIGCIFLQITTICAATSCFERGNTMLGAVFSILTFVNVFVFIFYNMSDRKECDGTIIGYEGVWEFLFHLLCYIPLGYLTLFTM